MPIFEDLGGKTRNNKRSLFHFLFYCLETVHAQFQMGYHNPKIRFFSLI
jgi:hypothetical protein